MTAATLYYFVIFFAELLLWALTTTIDCQNINIKHTVCLIYIYILHSPQPLQPQQLPRPPFFFRKAPILPLRCRNGDHWGRKVSNLTHSTFWPLWVNYPYSHYTAFWHNWEYEHTYVLRNGEWKFGSTQFETQRVFWLGLNLRLFICNGSCWLRLHPAHSTVWRSHWGGTPLISRSHQDVMYNGGIPQHVKNSCVIYFCGSGGALSVLRRCNQGYLDLSLRLQTFTESLFYKQGWWKLGGAWRLMHSRE